MIDIIFWFIAVLFSAFYGLQCENIWNQGMITHLKPLWLHELWFNFICSFIGWICFYLIIKSLAVFPLQDYVKCISWQHFILFLIAVLGITGLLPYTLFAISRTPAELIKKISK